MCYILLELVKSGLLHQLSSNNNLFEVTRAKITAKAVTFSRLSGGYRSARSPHFGTTPGPARGLAALILTSTLLLSSGICSSLIIIAILQLLGLLLSLSSVSSNNAMKCEQFHTPE